jgi:ATP-dependent exoDNAse (exonuclease V) alpha subunit
LKDGQLTDHITIAYTAPNSTLVFSRKQFPVCLAFAMTIDKSQGQTLKTVRINLLRPDFSHGQFYVAASRATGSKQLFILLSEGETSTQNIVYQDALLPW